MEDHARVFLMTTMWIREGGSDVILMMLDGVLLRHLPPHHVEVVLVKCDRVLVILVG